MLTGFRSPGGFSVLRWCPIDFHMRPTPLPVLRFADGVRFDFRIAGLRYSKPRSPSPRRFVAICRPEAEEALRKDDELFAEGVRQRRKGLREYVVGRFNKRSAKIEKPGDEPGFFLEREISSAL
jgi:hypothetical protein